jgi:hypothetical protein
MSDAYIVEQGQYSDSQLIAVSSTLELAKAAVKAHIELRDALAKTEDRDYNVGPYVDEWREYTGDHYRSYSFWEYAGDETYTISEFTRDAAPMPPTWP